MRNIKLFTLTTFAIAFLIAIGLYGFSQTVSAEDETATVYRFFNINNGAYLYTISTDEKNDVLQLQNEWEYEGAKFEVAESQLNEMSPVYRFFNTEEGGHIYTTSETERDGISQLDKYNYEGIKFYVHTGDNSEYNSPVFRFFDAEVGVHLYTSNSTERDAVEKIEKFNYENVGFYVKPYISANPEFGTFSSAEEMKEFMLENQFNTSFGFSRIAVDDNLAFSEESPQAASDTSTGNESSSLEFSETNNQVDGVDESDIIKTDGNYIYSLVQNYAYIVDVNTQTVVSEFEVPGYPIEMFLNDDQLVIFSRKDIYSFTQDVYLDYWGDFSNETSLLIYDISDRSNPSLTKDIKVEGYFSTARMIDNYVYLITSKSIYGVNENSDMDEIIPQVSEDSGSFSSAAPIPDIAYYGNQVSAFTTLAALDLTTLDFETEVMLGDSNNMYMSLDNLYLATVNYKYDDFPILLNSRLAVPENSELIPTAAITTDIYKVNIDGLNLTFDDIGSVEGTILNQFSMDESSDYFRVATTTNDFWGWNEESENNVFVLDSEMNTVGELTGLAEGETIYSTRFIGDRLYMVTFETIDPLFVIDLSTATNPTVLGELKIPGFSTYLHPYDEDHLIGIGNEVDQVDEFLLRGGLKISLFDVSDVNNPSVKSDLIIGDNGTYSEALYDHKAFLFDGSSDLMVLPVELYENFDDSNFYGDYTFSGFYMFDVSLTDGISVLNTVGEDIDLDNYTYPIAYNSPRSLYIGDNLYLFNDGLIEVVEMSGYEKTGEILLVE